MAKDKKPFDFKEWLKKKKMTPKERAADDSANKKKDLKDKVKGKIKRKGAKE